MTKQSRPATHTAILTINGRQSPTRVHLYMTEKSYVVVSVNKYGTGTALRRKMYISKKDNGRQFPPFVAPTKLLTDIQPIPENNLMSEGQKVGLSPIHGFRRTLWVSHNVTDGLGEIMIDNVDGDNNILPGLTRDDVKSIVALLQAEFDLNDKAVQLGQLPEAKKAEWPTVLQNVFVKKHAWGRVSHAETITPPDDQHRAFTLEPVMGEDEVLEGLAYLPSAVIDREDAKAIVAMLQAHFDLNDKAVQLGQLLEAMEDRHGETLDAFLKVMMRKAMVDNGLTEIVLNTSHLFSPTENIELELDASQTGKLIYRLPETKE